VEVSENPGHCGKFGFAAKDGSNQVAQIACQLNRSMQHHLI
jgi:hypothetical protein